MRYPQGGGLTAERQEFRERLRLQAAERFARGEASSVTAEDLPVSVRSVQRWRQAWDVGGPRAIPAQAWHQSHRRAARRPARRPPAPRTLRRPAAGLRQDPVPPPQRSRAVREQVEAVPHRGHPVRL
ncbi:helix-turn-helix domain-containing protein [Streptomyces mirabilis]|uniref:helix-turn-helix domain-containing protein n=1 Tax=Streptomyces mirabilis TaxID=68239 RepID=UPI0036CDD8D4